MNQVQLLGNLARDPEVRYTKSGKAVATFTIAASNTFVTAEGETKEQTAFVNCVAWGNIGEGVGNYRKGNRLFVNGRIQTRSYDDNNGNKKYVTEVVCDFVGGSVAVGGASSFENFTDDMPNNPQEQIPF